MISKLHPKAVRRLTELFILLTFPQQLIWPYSYLTATLLIGNEKQPVCMTTKGALSEPPEVAPSSGCNQFTHTDNPPTLEQAPTYSRVEENKAELQSWAGQPTDHQRDQKYRNCPVLMTRFFNLVSCVQGDNQPRC